MLDGFVIDQVHRRDRREREERESPGVQLPVPEQERPVRRSDQDGGDEKPTRGVVVIDLRA